MVPISTDTATAKTWPGTERGTPSRAGIPFGAVAIGRNEGDRLKNCMNSLQDASAIIYVDSGSSDDSVPMARGRGVEVVQLDMSVPFTASRARNAGLARLQQVAPELRFVQFVDGDCELTKGWCQQGASFLASHPGVAAVCGRLRERHPERSIYNWLCDKEWDGPVGEIKACAGNAMMSVDAVHAVGGYNEALIAGEEAELCLRLRLNKLAHLAARSRNGAPRRSHHQILSMVATAGPKWLRVCPRSKPAWYDARAALGLGIATSFAVGDRDPTRLRGRFIGSLALGFSDMADLSLADLAPNQAVTGPLARAPATGLFRSAQPISGELRPNQISAGQNV